MKHLRIYITAFSLILICCISAGARRQQSRSWTYPGPQDTTRTLQAGLTLGTAREVTSDDTALTPTDTIPDTPDSLTLRMIADSLALDSLMTYYRSLGAWDLDSATLWSLDSVCQAFYDSLALNLPDSSDIRKAKRRIRKEFRDSVRLNTPRVLETFVFDDSLYYRRMLKWTAEHRFNEVTLQSVDTLYNEHFNDYAFLRRDVDATYLGTIGSATQMTNFFKRDVYSVFPQMEPYLSYSFTPDNVPQFNTKNPYTELAYWGTLFALKAREELEVHVLVTQNITPATNFTLGYDRIGSNGMLQKEATDNRTFFATVNHIGKKYLAHGGFINHLVSRQENGGMPDPKWIRDTIVDPKEITVNLSSASNNLARRTFFLTQSYTIPMNFFRANKDSLAAGEGTNAFIGHSIEYTTAYKSYQDQISMGDNLGRAFYHDDFFINSSNSTDSVALRMLDNRLFVKLQPFAPDAVLARINGGVGYQMLSYFAFDPSFYLTGIKPFKQNNVYAYAGASGMFRKYFQWEADGQWTFAGTNAGDFDIGGRVRFSLYPWRDGIHVSADIRSSLTEPNFFYKQLHFNHHDWVNDFTKTSYSRLQASLEIPAINFKATAGYGLVAGGIGLDATSALVQKEGVTNIISAEVEENIRIWKLHFDNRVLYQYSSDQEVIPLPMLTLNLRYYVQFPLVKDALDVQIGANVLYHTKYYLQGYMPDLGMFYNQRDIEYGGDPYIDVFINGQWKRVSVFVKYTNAFVNRLTHDYFSASGYIRPTEAFKFGVFWPF